MNINQKNKMKADVRRYKGRALVFMSDNWVQGMMERQFNTSSTEPILFGCALQTSVENEQYHDESVSVRYFDVSECELIENEITSSSYVREVTMQKTGTFREALISGHARNK